MSDGELHITDINLSQTTEILHKIGGGNLAGQTDNRVQLVIEGQGAIFEEFINLLGTRPINLHSMNEQRRFSTPTPFRRVELTLGRINKHSLALFDFNNIRADRIRNEVDEFRQVVRGCTARLACISCKKLTILAKAMLIGVEDAEIKNDIFITIHRA